MARRIRSAALGMAVLGALATTAGCVSKGRYQELEASQALQESRWRETRSQLEARIDALSADILALREANANFERRHANVLEINNQLHDDILQLESELQKSRTIIKTQETVIDDIKEARETIENNLRAEIAAKDVVIEEMEGKLKVTLVDKILFNTGSDRINDPGRNALRQIARSLIDGGAHEIQVEGHTDDVPIGPALAERFPSNWELSAARAIAVVRFLEEKAGVDPARLSACAYSFHRPLVANDTQGGRRKNRRIEIILVPRD